ncbi:ATP-binding protein [Ferrovibrio terrae]|uniref:hybrid sensor histidine kinase/response regulator n=1 Tax=Ferrovibrio terrae TaxID=2594003 RepID=UPI003137A333
MAFEPRSIDAAINQRIFDTSVDLILVVDRTGNLIRVSPSSLVILGYPCEEMNGRSAIDFLYPEDLENTRNEMRLARKGRQTRNFKCRYVHRDGRVVPLVWTGVWSEPEQQHFFIGRDMTEHNAQEERLNRSQRLEAIGQLTGGIAHDFNNLLSVVIGNLDLLSTQPTLDKQAHEYLENALQASLRGAELTQQLLAFARRQSLIAQRFDLNERIAGTIALLRRTLGENIEIVTVFDDALHPVLADPAQFEAALVNLTINARDAMLSGGRLTIETHDVTLDEDYCRANTEVQPGDYVMTAVSDTGTGMTADIMARVFEPFFTTKPVGKGTGLGLSMVYGFARQSRGHIKVYSELDHGTTVRLYLPRATESGAALPQAGVTTQPEPRGGECILVVEDNVQVRKMAVAQLNQLGYQVIEAENGQMAFNILKHNDTIDLVFSDMVMPGGISGAKLAMLARGLRPGIKLLLTSGFAKGVVQNSDDFPAAVDFLNKPYRRAELAAKLRSLFDTVPR